MRSIEIEAHTTTNKKQNITSLVITVTNDIKYAHIHPLFFCSFSDFRL